MVFSRSTIVGARTLLGVAASVAGTQDRESHPAAFLEKLVGEWSVVAEATLGPGQEPVRTHSREVARLLGGKWLVAETTAGRRTARR